MTPTTSDQARVSTYTLAPPDIPSVFPWDEHNHKQWIFVAGLHFDSNRRQRNANRARRLASDPRGGLGQGG